MTELYGKQTAPSALRLQTKTPDVAPQKPAGFRLMGQRPSKEAVSWAGHYQFNNGVPSPITEGTPGYGNTTPAIYSAHSKDKTPVVNTKGASPNPPGHARIGAGYARNAEVEASRNMAISHTPARTGHPSTAPTLRRNREQAPPATAFLYGPSSRGSNTSHPEASVFGTGGGAVVNLRQIGRGDDARTKHL